MSAAITTDTRPSKRLSEWRISTSMMLRAASIITLLFAAGHTLGGLQSWSPAGETEVLREMRSFRFDADGVNRTYWDFYIGFGLMISVFMLGQSVVLWQLAGIFNRDAASVRPILSVFLLSTVAIAALAWRFFFTVPLVMALASAFSLGLALAVAPRQSAQR